MKQGTGLLETAAEIKKKGTMPVVVVGAGLGSLTAAAYLAKAGFPVTVIERQNMPGGYATSFQRASGRFTFDVSLHMVSAHGSPTEIVLRELALLDKVVFARLPELCRIISPDFDIVLPQADPDGCIRAFSTCFPDEEKGIRGFIEEIVGTASDVDRMQGRLSFADKILFPFRYPFLYKTFNVTLEEILKKHIHNAKLRSQLSVFWEYYGLPPSQLSGFYYAVGTGEYMRGGAYCYKPRSQALSDAFVEQIEQHGGKMVFNQSVDRIQLTKGAVSGVQLRGGERLKTRAVISGASGPATFEKLLPTDALSKTYRSKLNGLHPSISSFIVWLGLNRDIREQIENYEIFLLGDYDPEFAYQTQLKCDASRADLVITLFDNAFDGYSSPGTSTMSIMFLSGYEPWRRFEIDYFAGRKAAYNLEKARMAKTIVDRVEQRVVPELSSMIEVMEAATPLTNLRYTHNPGGAIYGYEQTMDNTSIKRVRNRTPIAGLYLAGAWAFPGGGFSGVHASGRNAFQNFLEDWG
jgi:prolycopene isomerase